MADVLGRKVHKSRRALRRGGAPPLQGFTPANFDATSTVHFTQDTPVVIEEETPKQLGKMEEAAEEKMEKGDRGMEMTDSKAQHRWGYLDTKAWEKEFEICGSGKMQSPVNIENSMVVQGSGVTLFEKMHYKPTGDLSLKNNGHTVQVDADDKHKLGWFDHPFGKYNVHHVSFHFPSEHEVDGKLAAGEMHIVHQMDGSDGTSDLLVVAVLFDEGAESPFLKQLGFALPMPMDGAKLPIDGKVDLVHAFESQWKGDFWRYDGSMTTPPCSETVRWFVVKDRATASKDQIAAFKSLYPNPSNNRPVQALHERKILLDSLQSAAHRAPRRLVSAASVIAVLGSALSFFSVAF